MSAKTADVHFELYTLREGRWVLDACFADEDEARDEAARTARRGEGRGVRLTREIHLPGMADPIVTVIVDTTDKAGPPAIRKREPDPDADPAPAPRPPAAPRAARRGDRSATPAVAAGNGDWPLWRAASVGALAACVGIGLALVLLFR